MNRRQFLKTSAGAAALLALRGRAYAYSVSMPLQKFIQPMPRFGVGIPILTPLQNKYDPATVDYYEVVAGVFRQQLHPNLANPTRLYGYADTATRRFVHLGGAIVGTTGKPVRVKFSNTLPAKHILPFDKSIMMPNTGLREDRAAVHLHGGLVPWTSDGGPFHWIANPANNSSYPAGTPVSGASQVAWLPDDTGALTGDNYYPNNQSARFMWYHDHAIGTTRTSAYAGLATGYILTDSVERVLGLDFPTEYIVFQDKVFWDPQTDPGYTTAVPSAVAGDLWYPYIYDKQMFKLRGGFNAKQNAAVPVPSAQPEMFGDTMLVNGVVYPFYSVNRGMYRLRLLNACNSRFLNLSFVVEDPLLPGEPMLNRKVPVWANVKVWQIGTEGGFLPKPVLLADPGALGAGPRTPLLLGPAERADLIVDFSGVPAGANVILYNDASAPFPAGSSMFDWFYGVKGVAVGFGPNTRTPMQFRVSASDGAHEGVPAQIEVPELPTASDPANGGLMMVTATGSNTAATIGQIITLSRGGGSYIYAGDHNLTLNEAFDEFGRLQQLMGTNVINAAQGAFGRAYLDAPTEFVQYNKIYIWNIFNLTADAHPMHFHLFNAQVLRRRPFRANQFNGTPIYTAPGLPPDANEMGWKETVKVYPGSCTTVAVLVEDPLPGRSVTVRAANGATYTGSLPPSPRLTSPPYNLPANQADEYVWHCHILEHEEHDMMRPLVAGG